MPPRLSVLIVNYNGLAYLDGCLTSLERQSLPRNQFEVILVDNASKDESLGFLRQRFPWVKVIASPTNLGFAGANNLAAAQAQATHLVLLNNDTLADPHFLSELLRVVERYPGAAVAAKMVLLANPRLLNSTGLFLLRDGRGADRGFRKLDEGQYEAEELVFGACGGAAVLPAPPPGMPLLDASFFLYCEDLEEAWRSALQGRLCVYAPRAVVRHAVGATGGDESPRFWYYVERNRVITSVRHGDPVLAFTAVMGLYLRVARAVVFHLLGRKQAKYRRDVVGAVARAARDLTLRLPGELFRRYERQIRTSRRPA